MFIFHRGGILFFPEGFYKEIKMNFYFIIRLMAMAVLAGAGYFFLMPYLPLKIQYQNFIYILLFFIASTSAFHYGLAKSAEAGGKHFIRYYMGASGIKLLLYVFIVILYSVINKAGAPAFAFCFLLFYVLFTALEVAVSYKQFGSVSKSPPVNNEF